MRKTWGAVILAVLLMFWELATVVPAFPSGQARQVFSTQKADIYCDSEGDLQSLAWRLGARGTGAPGQPDLALLAAQIDGMLEEISRVLQKWPLKPVKLKIRLLRDGFQVQQQQQALRRAPKQGVFLGRGSLESFYDPYSQTIFLSLADVRLGILAHEMTHFVLCESSPVWPSATFQESLAQYMEQRFMKGK